MRISYNPRFDERLESAGDYVAREFGEAASRRFKVTILEACHMLSIFPYMGFRMIWITVSHPISGSSYQAIMRSYTTSARMQ